MKAVVMAGGEGSRLRPITSNRPKPLVPVCNQPIMEHIVTLLKRHGLTEIVTTLYYLGDEIRGVFGDGRDHGVKMQYSVEPTPLGTAGSVKRAEALLGDEPFLIISGDALTDCDLTKAIEFHKSKGAQATLILYRVSAPLDFGVVITGEDGRIERFLEKPSWAEVFSDTVNTGMYIIEPEVLKRIPAGKSVDWSADVFPQMLAEGAPLYGYVMSEYWADVGSLVQYREAQEHLLAGRLDLPIQGDDTASGVHVGSNCNIDESAIIVPPVCIGRNTKIKRGARIGPYTVIGDNGFIEEDAIVERSVVWDSAYIGPGVGIHSAIVCSRATIKRDTVVREEAVVGDRCLVDVGCTIRPRVKLWPDKIVERGSTVTMSLIWGNKWRSTLFRDLGVAGLSNIEITPDFACRLGSAYGSCFPPGSKIVTSRDSTRSSRMIKRAIISSLLGVGCDVLDLRGMALPIARHFIKASGAGGAVNVRKLPGNARVTLVEMMNETGAYLSRAQERKVETNFFREDFYRTDPDDLGQIEFPSRAVEAYQSDFFHTLGEEVEGSRLRLVVDYGYSSLASIFPAMLAKMSVESISLNGFSDAKMAPRSAQELDRHVRELSQIVSTLRYDLGVLFFEEGERLILVDGQGRALTSHALLAAVGMLLCRGVEKPRLALEGVAPSSLVRLLESQGAHVARSRTDVRSLVATCQKESAQLGGDGRGGFVWPSLSMGLDAPFTLAQTLVLLRKARVSLSELVDALPPFPLAYEAVRVPWELKGRVMRRLSEETRHSDEQIDLEEGIKITSEDGSSWVLLLPDLVEPLFHVYAETPDEPASQELARTYATRIRTLLS